MKATKRENTILEGVIYKQILLFFFPILLGSFFQQLYSTSDAVIVGKFVHKEGLAAIGATTYIINILIGFFIGLSAGGSIIISQYYGASKNKELSKSVHTTIALGIACGILVMLIGLFFAPQILKIMNTPEEVYQYALLYLRIYFLGSIATVLYNVGSGILMAVGDSRSPLFVLIISTICNIILDLFFIAVLKMGILGAGIATVLSQVLSASLVLIILSRTELAYKLHFRKIRFHKNMLGGILKIGLPTGLQSTLFSLSNLIIQSSVNRFGTNTAAAWTALTRIDNLYWMILGALGISITTFVGQNFGAGKFDRMKEGVKVTLGFAAIVALSLSTLFYFGCEFFLNFFTSDHEVISLGVYMFRHYCQYYVFFIGIEILAGAIRGTGVSLVPTIIMAVGICFFRIAWIFIAVPLHPTIKTILTCYPITWFMTSTIFVLYYFHGGWLRKRKKAMGF